MATLIFPEGEREVYLRHLLHKPLSALAQLYSSSIHRLADVEDEKQGTPVPQQTAASSRLHQSAETCLSSLRAGTASIATNSANGVIFLNLPVGTSIPNNDYCF